MPNGKPYDWKALFLEALRHTPVVRHACEVAGIGRTVAYENRAANPDFAKAWDSAIEEGVDRIEQEALRRAVEGTEEPVYQGGQLVGTRRVYSDSLMALMLKGRRKSVFADRTEVTGADGGPVKAAVVIATGVPNDVPDADIA